MQSHLKHALKFGLGSLAAAYAVSFYIVWYRGDFSLSAIVNVMTGVALVMILVSLPMLGASRVMGGVALEADERESSTSADAIDNRLRGVALLMAAIAWLVAGIAAHSFLDG